MKIVTRHVALWAALLLPLVLDAAGLATQVGIPTQADPTEANVTRLTAGLLGASQFAHHPLDEKLASALLDRYLEILDADRSLFLRSEVARFASDRPELARDTRRTGDTRLAHAIFARYLGRLDTRAAFVIEALRDQTFDFTGKSVYSLDRTQASRPADLPAAKQLWLERLRFEYLQEKLDDKTPEQIVKTLRGRVERQQQAMKQVSADAVLEIYLSALANVYDPHSDYLGHEQLGEFNIAMNLSLFGIGAKLQSEDGHTKIVDLVPGGPAARSGQFHPGDRIVAVGQATEEPVDIVDLPLRRAVDLIRGPKGSVVKLTIIPASAADDSVRETIALVRDEIRLEDQRAKATIVDMPGSDGSTVRLGIIDLPSFYAAVNGARRKSDGDLATPVSATADVALLLQKLQAEKVQGVVLDLRRNGGGSLEEAINLTGLFIAEGPVVQTRGPAGDIDIGADTDPAVVYAGPLVVLTSRFSASASEILAGALQDYDRAIVVGDQSTFGKGTVQSVLRLAPIMDQNGLRYSHDPGALTVTIRKFYRPSGASTQLKGVVPDIVLPSLTGRSDVGESVLDNPLPWDTVPSSDYRHLNLVAPYRDGLREASTRRVANSQDFDYLRVEIARMTQRLASKTVSLNEAERRQELADVETHRKEHEKALAAHAGPMPIRYDVTVLDAARPGLPPPATLAESGAVPDATQPTSGADDTPGISADPPPQRDVVLMEAERILVDYVTMSRADAGRWAGPVQASATPVPPTH